MLLFLSPWRHQSPLPIYFMALLVQLDSSDVVKCAGGGMSRQPRVKDRGSAGFVSAGCLAGCAWHDLVLFTVVEGSTFALG